MTELALQKVTSVEPNVMVAELYVPAGTEVDANSAAELAIPLSSMGKGAGFSGMATGEPLAGVSVMPVMVVRIVNSVAFVTERVPGDEVMVTTTSAMLVPPPPLFPEIGPPQPVSAKATEIVKAALRDFWLMGHSTGL